MHQCQSHLNHFMMLHVHKDRTDALILVDVANEPLPGGGACSQDPLTFLDFIPCSPLLKPLVPKNDFSSCSLDPQNYCAVPLIPRNFYPCSPYLFTCFTFLFIVKEIAFEPPLSSPCNPFMLKFIDRHFCQLN